MNPLLDTLVDGELVIDVDPVTKKVRALPLRSPDHCFELFSPQETVRFLAFDCLVADKQNVMSKSLDKRYGVRLLHILRRSKKLTCVCVCNLG